jgi:hypothetical protein
MNFKNQYRLLIFLIQVIFFFSSLKQANAQYDTLDGNQVRAFIWDNGCMFWDLVANAKYEVPKGSGINSIFADAFWIGGLDVASALRVSAQTYRQSRSDFWPGPLDTINATTDSLKVQAYNRVWKIDRYTVDEFITQYQLGNVANGNYQIPDIILQWPASDTGNYSRHLAPYIDNNNDGIYNPYDGDYPEMKGDQMLWTVFNDTYKTHTESGGQLFGLEIHCSSYVYNCPLVADSEQVINYTTFYHYKIFNRGSLPEVNVYMGRFTDSDLGNPFDDYVGCDTILNCAFTYNGDNYDDGIMGYGLNPPIQNLLYLSDTITHFIFYNNDFSNIGNPVVPADYYNYMKGIWKDPGGMTHLTYGGDGHGSGSGATNIQTNYMFPGNPYDTLNATTWNEINAGNTPGDRRFITSTGPFNFPAHSEKDFDFAYVWTRDATHPNGMNTSWAKNVHDVMKIKNWYATDSFPCNNSYVGIHEVNQNISSLNIYPNPATHELNIFFSSKNYKTAQLEISDVTGRIIRKGLIFLNRNNPISVEEFSPGINFVKVNDGNSFRVKKFIKQ